MNCYQCGTENTDNEVFCSKCGNDLRKPTIQSAGSNKPAISATATVSKSSARVYYAGFWRRFLAVIIDGLILDVVLGIGFGIEFLSKGASRNPNTFSVVEIIFNNIGALIIPWLYFALMESSSKQATLGKMSLGIIVTDLTGNRISFGKANARYWGKIVSVIILGIGYIMAGFTQKKQALHDIMAKALVVNKQKQPTSKTVVAIGVAVGILPMFIAILAAIIIPNFMAARPWVKEAAVKGGMSRIVYALNKFANSNGGIYPESLTDRKFLALFPEGQLPGNPYKDNACIFVAEEKTVVDPLNYALINSGCKGKTTEGEINYYYSPATKPTSWAINGCNENGVIKQDNGTNFVLHN